MAEGSMQLSDRDVTHLRNVKRKRQLLRDRIVAVARGLQTGCLVYGAGGMGKSHTILEELERMGTAYTLCNSHMTALTLFARLEQYPDQIHVIEDAEQILRNKPALGVLRSGLWGNTRDRDGRYLRNITWNSRGRTQEVVFTGGIVLVTNRGPNELPEFQALETRISTLEFHLSFEEAAAEMHRIALQGYQWRDYILSAEECVDVMTFVLQEARRLNRTLDLRLLVNSFQDRLQAELHEAGCDWRDLVASRVRKRPSVVEPIAERGQRQQTLNRELAIAKKLVDLPRDERLAVWKKETGKSQASMYRRLGQLVPSAPVE